MMARPQHGDDWLIGASAGDRGRTIDPISATRSELLNRFERWTQARKIRLCQALCAEAILASEAMLAHGLAPEEIDRWMEAYKRRDFEALKVGYGRRRRRREARWRRPEGYNSRYGA
jgi:uncharacterized protein DUF1153